MHAIANKRERLGRFVDLARVYRGWTKTELSAALHRDPTKLIPQSGNPKLDLIAGIADALDWTIGDVAESVCQDLPSGDESHEDLSFKELDEKIWQVHRDGKTDLVVSIEMGIVFSAAFYFAFRPGSVAPTNLNMKLSRNLSKKLKVAQVQ